jgi:hypothetical protein
MPRLVVPGSLRQFTDGESTVELALVDGATLADLLEALSTAKPALGRRWCPPAPKYSSCPRSPAAETPGVAQEPATAVNAGR